MGKIGIITAFFCILSLSYLCFWVVDLSGYRCRTECMEDGNLLQAVRILH